ncbi:MAG: hypothetical protein Q4F57_08855 [Weeksellaceae bacterium]|nr:hypothetical protein [Weeksellaceae bacterium]
MKKFTILWLLTLSVFSFGQTKVVFVAPASNPISATGNGDGSSWENAYTSIITALQTNMSGFSKLEVHMKTGDYFNENGVNVHYGGAMSTLPNGVDVEVTGGYSAILRGTNITGYNPTIYPTNLVASAAVFQVGKEDGNLTVRGINAYDPANYYSANGTSYVSPFVNINRADGVFRFEDIKVIITQPVSDDPGIGIFNINNNQNQGNSLYFDNVVVNGVIEGGVITLREQTDDAIIEIRNSKFHNNRVTVVDGAVLGLWRSSRHTVRIYDSEFVNNRALITNGGAIALRNNSSLHIERTVFKDNRTTSESAANNSQGQGGAIAITGNSSFTSIDNIYVCNYVQTAQGGALWINNGTSFTSTGDSFIGNYVRSLPGTTSANGQDIGGGAIAIYDGVANITNASFVNNWATQLGGAILVRRQQMNITNTEFIENRIQGAGADSFRGGAINAADLELLNITDGRFLNNQVIGSSLAAQRNGGAIQSIGTNLTITGTSAPGQPKTAWFRGNSSAGAGGAIWTDGDRTYTFNNVGFYENHSGFENDQNTNGGGALFFSANNQGLNIDNSDFFGNTTWVTGNTNGGGAIKIDGAIHWTRARISSFTNNRFKDNRRNNELYTGNTSGGSDIKLYFANIVGPGTGTILQMQQGLYNADFPNNIGLTYNGQSSITLPAYPTLTPEYATCDDVVIQPDSDFIILAQDDIFDGQNGLAPIPAGTTSTVSVLANDFYRYTATGSGNVAATLSNVTITVIAQQSPNVSLDPATGLVSVAPNTGGGYYWIEYEIQDQTNPELTDRALVWVFVPGPCFRPAFAGTTNLPTHVAISTIARNTESFNTANNGFIQLESQQYGFVPTRLHPDSRPSESEATEGMMYYDIVTQCLTIFDGTQWKCTSRGCNDL